MLCFVGAAMTILTIRWWLLLLAPAPIMPLWWPNYSWHLLLDYIHTYVHTWLVTDTLVLRLGQTTVAHKWSTKGLKVRRETFGVLSSFNTPKRGEISHILWKGKFPLGEIKRAPLFRSKRIIDHYRICIHISCPS